MRGAGNLGFGRLSATCPRGRATGPAYVRGMRLHPARQLHIPRHGRREERADLLEERRRNGPALGYAGAAVRLRRRRASGSTPSTGSTTRRFGPAFRPPRSSPKPRSPRCLWGSAAMMSHTASADIPTNRGSQRSSIAGAFPTKSQATLQRSGSPQIRRLWRIRATRRSAWTRWKVHSPELRSHRRFRQIAPPAGPTAAMLTPSRLQIAGAQPDRTSAARAPSRGVSRIAPCRIPLVGSNRSAKEPGAHGAPHGSLNPDGQELLPRRAPKAARNHHGIAPTGAGERRRRRDAASPGR